MPLFTYPDYGSPPGFPDHVARSGQQCTIVRELGDDERDPEVGRMFMARFSDGAELQVLAMELDVVPACPQCGSTTCGVVGEDHDDVTLPPAPFTPEAYGSDVEYLGAIGELGGPMDEVQYAVETEERD